MEVKFVGDSGQLTLIGAVRRDSDNYIYNPGASAFQPAPSLANRKITITEASGFPGLYIGDVDPAAWSDGYYTFVVQDSGAGAGNIVMGANEIYISDGAPGSPGVSAGAYVDSYYADIEVNRDTALNIDEYTAIWFKNGAPVESGITSPVLHLRKRDTSVLLNNVSMSGVADGVYRYDSAANINRGESYIVTVRATIDGSQRTSKKVIGRDT